MDFLGVMTRNAFVEGLMAAVGERFADPGYFETDYPQPDEEYFEWVDLLESVSGARNRFTMVDLGAGFGRWLVKGAAAVRQCHGDLPIKLIGVEAEPTHFEWLKQHFNDNGLDPAQHELIEAAVDGQERTVRFCVGKPDEWWGQKMSNPFLDSQGVPCREVKTITLSRILGALGLVDLIDLDVEKAELVVLQSAIEELNQKVKRVHIGTHTPEIEQGLRALFWEHGWYKRNDYGVGRTELTEWGEMHFGNGVQTWLNPRLSAVQPISAELTWLQWAIRSSDFRYGTLQEEERKLKIELDNARREASAFENKLKDQERQVSTLEQTVEAQKHEITGLRQQLGRKISELAELKDRERQVSAVQQTVEAQKHEITRLRQQLEGWEKHWQSVENSAGWRLLSAWRSMRDLIAPEKTWRRRLYDSVISRLRPHTFRRQL
ncbi:MAG TPA: FkbM family methyltransferase [Nitrospira sp.]|nr:FkbM family methyltransferase [Nitrospira sp.]